jgi:tyrosinase
MPYWDWASNSQIPAFVNGPTVQITGPYGPQTISNPLFQYKFQQFPMNSNLFPNTKSTAYDWYLAQYPQTVRDPDSIGAGSDFNTANTALGKFPYKSYIVCSSTSSGKAYIAFF